LTFDISQACDKVRYDDLLLKFQQQLPKQFHAILNNSKVILTKDIFSSNNMMVYQRSAKSGVPLEMRGSILDPFLYLLNTAEPADANISIVIFADYTAILQYTKFLT
jgi:hypothetical protein